MKKWSKTPVDDLISPYFSTPKAERAALLCRVRSGRDIIKIYYHQLVNWAKHVTTAPAPRFASDRRYGGVSRLASAVDFGEGFICFLKVFPRSCVVEFALAEGRQKKWWKIAGTRWMRFVAVISLFRLRYQFRYKFAEKCLQRLGVSIRSGAWVHDAVQPGTGPRRSGTRKLWYGGGHLIETKLFQQITPTKLSTVLFQFILKESREIRNLGSAK